MTIRGKAALAVLAAFAAVPAQASDKQDFEACDGRVHPGKQDDGMRGEASRSRFSFAFDRGGVAACTRALASPRLLPAQSLRRAHLLRARAAAHLKAGNATAALADLDLAEAATADRAQDVFYRRSMGVSLSLLRAIAHTQSGKIEVALPLARAAMEARPYSLQVQQTGAAILQAGRSAGAASPSPWASVVRLHPEAASRMLIEEAEAGNFANTVALGSRTSLTWPATPLKSFSLLGAGNDDASRMITTMIASLHVAYARAATGDPSGARRDLADVRSRYAASRAAPVAGAAVLVSVNEALDKFIELRARQIDARIAVADGRPNDALAVLIAAPLPKDAATVELLTALKAASESSKPALPVPDVAPFRAEFGAERIKGLARLAPNALIAPETPRAVVDYSKARPNILGALVGGALSMGTSLLGGIQRTDGFRSTANADGTTKVEFIGNTPSAPLVQEMTLLRAAEITRAAGKASFVIVDRKDYSRVMRTMQYGSEISSVPTGFKTELTIRPVDAGTDADRAFDAIAIIDALGPLYYEEKKTTT